MAANLCPNMESVGWKKLLTKYNNDGIKAYEEWERNGQRFTTDPLLDEEDSLIIEDQEEYQKESEKAKKIIEKAKVILNQRVKELVRIKDSSAAKAFLKRFREVLTAFDQYTTETSLLSFISTSKVIVDSYGKWLKSIEEGKAKDKYGTLKRILDSINSLELIDGIGEEDYIEYFNEDNPFAFENLKGLKYTTKEEVEADIQLIRSSLIDYKRRALDLAKRSLAEDMGPYLNRIENYFRRKAEIMFNQNEASKYQKNKKELAEKRKEFIEDYISNNRRFIDQESKRYMENIFNNLEDISQMTNWFVNPRDISNEVVQFITEKMDEQDFKMKRDLRDAHKELDKLVKSYEEYRSKLTRSNDPNKSNLQNYYSPLLAFDENNFEYNIIDKSAHEDEYKEFEQKYQSTPVFALWEYLTKLKVETNRNLPNIFKLRSGRLPKIEQDTIERYNEQGIKAGLRFSFENLYKANNLDNDSIIYSNDIDLNNKKINHIPVRYRGTNEATSFNRSWDLPTILLLDYQNSLSFSSKLEISSMMEVLKDTVGESQVLSRNLEFNKFKATKRKIMKSDTVEVTKEGTTTGLYQQIESLLEQRLYGIGIKGDPNLVKITNNIKSYVSKVSMALNPWSALTNFTHGEFMVLFDGLGTGGLYTIENRINASKKYDGDILNIMEDATKAINTSKTNLLMELLNIENEVIKYDYDKNNILKKILDSSPLMMMNHIGDYSIRAVTMYSILDNIKVKDINGDYINKLGNPTNKREEGISIDEAYEVVDGKLKLKFEEIVSTERTTGDLDLVKIGRLIKGLQRAQFGNNQVENKTIIERTALGSLMFHMRNWLVPGLMKRWSGISTFNTRNEEMTLEQLDYNNETESFREGAYTTTLRFTASVIKDLRRLKKFTLSPAFNSLTQEQKSNIYKTLAEFGAIISLFIIYSFFHQAAKDTNDEEDKYTYLYFAYCSRRIYGELFSFGNIKELMRTFSTPAVSLSFTENFIDMVGQLFDPLEEYETGIRKGEYKIQRKISKLIPVWGQFEKDTQESLNNLLRF